VETVSRQQFRVRIDVELPEEACHRIERAIQKAVLSELAETDVADGYSVVMRAPAGDDAGAAEAADMEGDLFGGSGSTDGIWIRDEHSNLP
jgi:hypothetical protein